MPNFEKIATEAGPAYVAFDPAGRLTHLVWRQPKELVAYPSGYPPLDRLKHELDLYFAERLRDFTTPMAPSGTEFQHAVWALLQQIPYGKTVTYMHLAEQLGDSAKARAVGSAVGANPISILIPCHRVIGTGGMMTGYSGGMDIKRKLLELENAIQRPLPLF